MDVIDRLTVYPVRDLPDSDYTREKVPLGCMTEQWRPTRYMRLLSRLVGRRCCWYHSGDWRIVSEAAVQLLRDAQRAGLSEAGEVRDWIDWKQAGRGLSKWGQFALYSLFDDPITPPDEPDGFYGNGRHRARAIRDSGAVETVVVVYEYTD